MRPFDRPAGLTALLCLHACAEPPAPPMLHAVPSFAGDVEVRGPSGETRRYELSFARQNGYFAAKFEIGGRVITLLAGPGGALRVFEDASPRPATADEAARYALLRALVDPAALDRVEPGTTTYRVWRAGAEHTVHILPVTGFHGTPGGGKGGSANAK